MGNVGELIVASVIDWLHLIATVTWIGGIFLNILAIFPAAMGSMDRPTMGRFLNAYTKRFQVISYVSMGILVITGTIMMLTSPNYEGATGFSNPWSIFLLLKHIFIVVLIVWGIYISRVLNPKIERAAAQGDLPEVAKLQKLLPMLGIAGFGIGLLVLLFTAITSVV
jgi:uncharacterized membrane protein